MSIEFSEENVSVPNRNIPESGMGNTSGMGRFLIKKGIVSSEKQASGLLIGVCVCCLLLSGYIFYSFVFGNSFTPKGPSPEEIESMRELQERMEEASRNNQRNQGIPIINQ